MAESGFVWQCDCGHIEYGDYPPEECASCDSLDSFMKVPEDEIQEKVEENVLSMKPEDDEDEEEVEDE
jgi:hypothetical protein